MNPFPLLRTLWRGRRATLVLFVLLIAAAVALGVAATAQERALRQGSARASDAFDLVVAAPGSQTDVLLAAVFLRPTAMELLPGPVLARLLAEPRATMVAPVAFGDSYQGSPVVGTTAALVERLSPTLAEGRLFAETAEAVVGATVDLEIGAEFAPTHGMPAEHDHDHGHGDDDEEHEHEHEHAQHLTVVGRMQPTGTPWDRAVVVPVEFAWEVHGLPNGHAAGGHAIGPPFVAERLPGVPAVVVTPESVIAAYGLRNTYRTADSMAFFPAEALYTLYDVLGDIRRLVSALTFATQTLVVAAIVLGLLLLVDLQRRRLALLRVLGAPREAVFLTVWLLATGLVAIGAVAGLGLGYATSAAVSSVIAGETGIVLPVAVGPGEVGLAAAIVVVGGLLALIPAAIAYRRPPLPL